LTHSTGVAARGVFAFHQKPEMAFASSPMMAVLFCVVSATSALAVEKPPLSPDQPALLATSSRVSATIEFPMPALAAAIERDIPRRLATFNQQISCVHKRVLGFEVKANCDVAGYVERSGHVALAGKGDRIIGTMPVYGTVAGHGANKITSGIHGTTDARVTIEGEARPELRRDWSLELNFSDGFHWSQPPYLHILGHEISLAHFVEPKIRAELAKVKAKVKAAARGLDLHKKAATAWQQAFTPIKLVDKPEVWLQLKPQSAAFAGIRANNNTLSGSLELSGSVETFVGQAPPPVTPTPLAPLGTALATPGKFDIVLPVSIGYDLLRQKIMELAATMPAGDMAVREVTIYPSSGKLVVGARLAKSSDTDAKAGDWVYLSATPQIDPDQQTLRIPDLALVGGNGAAQKLGNEQLIAQLRQQVSVSYRQAYKSLLGTVNQRLSRSLGSGFRMQGHLASARPEKILLLADGASVLLHATGDLKILYGD
jgi:hypothetical protein